MRPPRSDRSRPARRRPSLGVAITLVAAALALGVPWGTAAGAPTPMSWSNGIASCAFDPSGPNATVDPVAEPDGALVAGLGPVEEVGADNTTVATADLGAAGWTAWNASDPDDYSMAYAAEVPIVSSAGGASIGNVSVSVDYDLPVSGSGPAANVVVARISLLGWAWRAPTDHLVLGLHLAVAQPAVAGFAPVAPGSAGASVYSTAGGRLLDSFAPSPTARVVLGGGSVAEAPVVPTFAVGPDGGTVDLSVGNASTGPYSNLTYAASIVVAQPTSIAGVPLGDYAIVGAVGSAVTLGAALGLYRSRRRPSRFELAEDP